MSPVSPSGAVADSFDVAVIIVGFRNSGDVRRCVEALCAQRSAQGLRIFISENGGSTAFDDLMTTLGESGLRIAGSDAASPPPVDPPGRRCLELAFREPATARITRVHIAEMEDNLGYAGGVNAWLRPLLEVPGWRRAWILNPDTQPTPTALSELVAHADTSKKGLIGSRMTLLSRPDLIQTRGLSWSRLRAGVVAIDGYTPAAPPRDQKRLMRQLDGPTGASMFVDRDLIGRIGLMPEHYFLYGEDLVWGLRAKSIDAVGYADESVVLHQGGSTIGTARRRRDKSALSVYLYARNRILIVRDHFPGWTAWTVLMSLAHILTFAAAGALDNFRIAWRGFRAGLAGETGRPDL
jgi:N-acetylglucosaminyl-diphospho-decaprenol L-rhamnosyltransferase